MRQSGVDFQQGDPYQHGVLIGSGIGGLEEIEQNHSVLYDRGPSRVSPLMIPKLMVNAASGAPAMPAPPTNPSAVSYTHLTLPTKA